MRIHGSVALMAVVWLLAISTTGYARDNGVAVDLAKYAERPTLADFTAGPCADNPRGLVQVKGSLYRHTTGPERMLRAVREGVSLWLDAPARRETRTLANRLPLRSQRPR